MTCLSNRLQFRISGASALCEEVRSRGFDSFEHLAEHVRELPYGRTANVQDPLAVLRQECGTCSAKHQLLAAVARDCGHTEVQLTVGIYEMSEENTPGVGNVLNAASLTSIPEAHCYLSIEGDRFDFTGLSAGSSSPFASLVAEYTVSPTNLPRIKAALHGEAIAAWASDHGTSKEAAWVTREACIAALAANAVIETMSGPAITTRQATAEDIAAMNDLMQASSAYQGQYKSILVGYELTSAQIERDHVYIAEEHAKVLGFYSLIASSTVAELDLLFVSDAAQGFGIGSTLIAHLKQLASSLGISVIRIVSHPPALDFYVRMGAKIIGTSPPHGRVTWERPVLALPVTSEPT
jgi:N-acetylglutamate synthase-like GNAT family acetyltransferase